MACSYMLVEGYVYVISFCYRTCRNSASHNVLLFVQNVQTPQAYCLLVGESQLIGSAMCVSNHCKKCCDPLNKYEQNVYISAKLAELQ